MSDNKNALETKKEADAPVNYNAVGVRFRSCGKIYTFDVDDIDATPGTQVVVDSELGLSLGHVVTEKHVIEKSGEPLKKIIRIANEQDFETVKSNRSLQDEAKAFCIEKVRDLNLPMKIVTTETTLDKKRLIFYFTADGRIDFRELVRELAAKFKTRIEMRQIGVRDEVKMLGGFGVCGRQTCCNLFLTSFEPITIRMAKQQDLSINQSKLSGICGRLMCCLGYEFRDAAQESPGVRDENPAVSEGPAGDELISLRSESIVEDTVPQQAECTCQCKLMPEEKEKPLQPDPEKPWAKKPEETARDKKQFKRHRRKRKRQRAKQPAHESVQHKKPEPLSPDARKEDESKDKGKPFNKRRKFWKKKKKN